MGETVAEGHDVGKGNFPHQGVPGVRLFLHFLLHEEGVDTD
jgi:hypothetical protein